MNGYLILAGLIVTGALFGGSYAKGRIDGTSHTKTLWQADIKARDAVTEQVQELAREESAAVAAQTAIDKAKSVKGYQDELRKINAAVIADTGRLRITDKVCADFAPGKTESASGSGATTTGTVALPESLARDIQRLMVEADSVTAACRVTQQFIADQGMKP